MVQSPTTAGDTLVVLIGISVTGCPDNEVPFTVTANDTAGNSYFCFPDTALAPLATSAVMCVASNTSPLFIGDSIMLGTPPGSYALFIHVAEISNAAFLAMGGGGNTAGGDPLCLVPDACHDRCKCGPFCSTIGGPCDNSTACFPTSHAAVNARVLQFHNDVGILGWSWVGSTGWTALGQNGDMISEYRLDDPLPATLYGYQLTDHVASASQSWQFESACQVTPTALRPTYTPTPTPTALPSTVCCECGTGSCPALVDGRCPTPCVPVENAVCVVD